MKTMAIVNVKWVSTITHAGWRMNNDINRSNLIVNTVGFLIKDYLTSIIIAPSTSEGRSDMVTEIPRDSIISIKELDEKQ